MATSFSYGTATYGRSAAGLKTLSNNLQTNVTKACNALSGKDYTTFVNTVKKNWSGADANAFLKSFQSDVNRIQQKIKDLSKKIDTTLTNDSSAFVKMQSTNASKF